MTRHDHSNDKYIVGAIFVGLMVLALAGVVWMGGNGSVPAPTVTVGTSTVASSTAVSKYDDFAKCLAEKKVTMYGAYWCSHCKTQKELFGTAFQYVPYVECTEQAKLCLAKDIKSYPTWMSADGKKLVGEKTFEELSAFSGCALPK